MKRLDELGVSPAPWREKETGAVSAYVFDGADKAVFFGLASNARLIAAAPDLYECLRKAVCDYCRDRICWDRCRNECLQKDNEALSDNEVLSSCPAKRWRKAIEKAGGVELSGTQIKVHTTRKRKGGEVMERQEIEAELNEMERDLADIARRAHIAASNLRSVADGCGRGVESADYRKIVDGVDDLKCMTKVLLRHLQDTRANYNRYAVALMEGDAE